MRQVLVKRNFYKQVNEDRINNLVNVYEALCEVAYDPKHEHKCWTMFIKELGYELDIDILAFKEKIDRKIDWLVEYIEQGLDKNQND
jgi:hypothetical protein